MSPARAAQAVAFGDADAEHVGEDGAGDLAGELYSRRPAYLVGAEARCTGFDRIILETCKLDSQPCIRGLRFTVADLYDSNAAHLEEQTGGLAARAHGDVGASLGAVCDGLDLQAV